MIYIISEESDITTNYVMEYIIANKERVKRLNFSSDSLIDLNIISKNTSFDLKINKSLIRSSDFIWFRRARLNFIPQKLFSDEDLVISYLTREENALNKSLEILLKYRKRTVGTYLKEVENYKIVNLILAKEAGFLIPETIVTSEKKTAVAFLAKHKKIISKDLRYPVNLFYKDYITTTCGTLEVKREHLESLDNYFFPIFLQRNIKKYIELRLFIFNKKIYSMAIFSQNDKQTELDYRNFDKDRPNRLVPFQLPIEVENKVFMFMKLSDLDSGSIDLILDKYGDYFFLEINPQGQIDWLSNNCNYYIEQDIANHLMS